MQPANGTHLLFLEGEGILFSESSQKIFHLNTIATYVWCLIEEKKSAREIVDNLQSTFSLSTTKADEYLRQTEQLFESMGILAGNQELPDEQNQEPPCDQNPHQYGDSDFIAERRYRLLSSSFAIRFTDLEQVSLIDPVLGQLTEENPDKPTVTIDIIKNEASEIGLYRDKMQQLVCSEPSKLAPLVKGLVWQTAVVAHSFFLDIHAGVVGDGQYCYLLPAAPGSGKSTLTAALVHSGLEYFSDEVALLDESNFHVQPVPLATCVKNTGIEALSPYYPELPLLTEHLRGDGKRVRYMPPIKSALPPSGISRPVGAIIFPKYAPDQQARISCINALEALQRLLEECLIVDTHLDLKTVIRLLNWIKKTPCYSLKFNNLDEAISEIKVIIQESKKGNSPTK